MKKSNVKIMIAAAGALIAVGATGFAVAKKAGFKFRKKSNNKELETADFNASLAVNNEKPITLDNEEDAKKTFELLKISDLVSDKTTTSVVSVKNTGAKAQNVEFSTVIEAATEAIESQLNISASYALFDEVNKTLELRPIVDSTLDIELEAGCGIMIEVIAKVENPIEAEIEDISGAVNAVIDIKPVVEE